jgi:hypothetical protein
MDSSSIASMASSIASAQTDSAVGVAVLKKALDIQSQNAMQLLQALPQPAPASNPPNLGNRVDTFA